MKKFILLIILVLSSKNAFSQVAVVSEIYNGYGPNSEWTELLVIEDKISLVGYSIRDNSGNDSWQGGVKFKNHELWKNLRAGTIIVINHRNIGAPDADKSDGYIEINAENTEYFSQYMTSTEGLPWDQRAINLNGTHEMIQLRDNNDNNVHTLGYFAESVQPSADFDAIGGPKISYDGGNGQGGSARVVPGSNLSQYSRAIPTDTYVAIGSDDSPGLPNTSSSSDDDNQAFWRELRQPEWKGTNKTINYNITPQAVVLNWEQAQIDFDPVMGYLLLKFPSNQVGNVEPPVDGTIYNVGDMLGSAEVIANIPQLGINTYSDTDFDCGQSYRYRLYAYRYEKSQKGSQYDNDPENARGRSYNESTYAQSEVVSKEQPNKPDIYIEGDREDFCDFEKIVIKVRNYDELQDYEFSWNRSGNEVSTDKTDEIDITSFGPGLYSLTVASDNGCTRKSNTLKIQIYATPEALISNESNKIFNNDTIIKICPDEDFVFRSKSKDYDLLIWIKDGVIINSGIEDEISVNAEGDYILIGSNANTCIDTSITVTIDHIETNFTVTPQPLQINADIDDTEEITITNTSSDPLTIFDFNLPAEFELVTPQPPMTIGPGNSLTLTIRYNFLEYGTISKKGLIIDKCDSREDFNIIDLIGIKSSSEETLVKFTPQNGFDYGIVSTCHMEGTDSLTISVVGPKGAEIRKPAPVNGIILDYPFTFPYVLEPNTSLSFEVVLTDVEGIYNGTIDFPYFIEGEGVDTLKVPFNGEVVKPILTFDYNVVDFGNLSDCITEVDSFLVISNETNIQIRIEEQILDTRIELLDLPVIFEPGDSKQVEFTYYPETNNDDFTFPVWNFPCKEDPDIINIKSNKNGINVSLANNTVNFGTVNSCDTARLTKQAEFNTVGGVANITNIEHFPNPDYFIINNFNDGLNLSGTQQFDVEFTTNITGNYSDSLVFYYDPCNIRKVLYLTGTYRNTSLEIVEREIDFGTVKVDEESQEESFEFTNIGDSEIKIESIDDLTTEFILTNPSVNDFPITLESGQSQTFTFKFAPTSAGIKDTDILLNISEPCDFSETVKFLANADANITTTLKISIPNDVKLTANENGFIPVRFQFANGYDHISIEFDSLSLELSYDPTVIYPQGIFAGPSLNTDGTELFLEEISPGTLIAKIDFIEDSTINSGEVLRINAKGLIGRSTTTDVNINKVNFLTHNDTDISIETEDGIVEIIGDCLIDGRLVSLDNSTSILINDGSILMSDTKIDYEISTHHITIFEMFDLKGNKVKTFNNNIIQPGKHETFLNIDNYSNGLYYLVLKNGTITKVKRIMIIK